MKEKITNLATTFDRQLDIVLSIFIRIGNERTLKMKVELKHLAIVSIL